MFCGLVVLSLPITIIGANFDDEYRELRKRARDEKERARRRERALLRQQQQQQHALAEKGGCRDAREIRGRECARASRGEHARRRRANLPADTDTGGGRCCGGGQQRRIEL